MTLIAFLKFFSLLNQFSYFPMFLYWYLHSPSYRGSLSYALIRTILVSLTPLSRGVHLGAMFITTSSFLSFSGILSSEVYNLLPLAYYRTIFWVKL